jgi:hypothetical protein
MKFNQVINYCLDSWLAPVTASIKSTNPIQTSFLQETVESMIAAEHSGMYFQLGDKQELKTK